MNSDGERVESEGRPYLEDEGRSREGVEVWKDKGPP